MLVQQKRGIPGILIDFLYSIAKPRLDVDHAGIDFSIKNEKFLAQPAAHPVSLSSRTKAWPDIEIVQAKLIRSNIRLQAWPAAFIGISNTKCTFGM